MPQSPIAGLLLASACFLAGSPGTAETSSAIGDGPSSAAPLAAVGASPEANLFSGSMAMTIPIVVPPGRANATPALALSYSSAGGDGPFGIGWGLAIGSISRSTKHGVPRCVGPYQDEYVLNIAGGAHELVPTPATGDDTFLMRRDEAYLEATPDRSLNTWTVRDRSGRTFRFGAANGAQTLAGATIPARVHTGTDTFRSWYRPPSIPGQDNSPIGTCDLTSIWALTQIEDPNGNVIDFVYLLDSGGLYPQEISYGGNGSAPNHPFRVRFATAPRSFAALAFRAGVREQYSHAITQIAVEADADDDNTYTTVRTYSLDYSGANCLSAAVASIRLCAVAVSTPGGSSLPTQRFEYSSDDFQHGGTNAEFTQDAPGAVVELRKSDEDLFLKRTVMDATGDGFVDLISSSWSVFPGSASGFAVASVPWSANGAHVGGRVEKPGATGFTTQGTLDVTGDGRPDFVYVPQNQTLPYSWEIYPGQCTPAGSGQSCGFATSAVSYPATWETGALYTLESGYRYHVAFTDGDENFEFRRPVDMNGDGLIDIVSRELVGSSGSGLYKQKVFLNTGAAFQFAEDFDFWTPADKSISTVIESGTERITNHDLVDFNGDGLPDMVYYHAGNAAVQVRYNNGRGFEPSAVFVATGQLQITQKASPKQTLRGFVDVNSDGLPDLVDAVPETSLSVQLNLGGTQLAPSAPYSAAPGITTIQRSSQRGNTRVDFIDWNGDGLLDHVDTDTLEAVSIWKISLGRPKIGPWIKPNLLIKADTGVGGITEVRYAPSSRFDNSPADTPTVNAVQELPLVTYVVTGIRRTDGLGCVPQGSGDALYTSANSCVQRGHELVQELSYEGGKFDAASREFVSDQ